MYSIIVLHLEKNVVSEWVIRLQENREIRISSSEKDDMERLIQLFMKMSLIGFDELEMSEREETVRLFGDKIKYGIQDFNRRLTVLEEKVQSLES